MFHSRNCEKFVLKPVVLNVLQPHYSMARTIWNCYFKTVCTGLFTYGLTFKHFLKEQGSYSLAQNMGHKGPVIKA